MIDNSKEYILCAALKRKVPRNTNSYHQNDLDQIEIGYRHHDIRNRFGDEVSCSPKDQGFYTSKGRFVDRKFAYVIAVTCGQIPPPDNFEDFNNGTKQLFSEDLY